MLRTFEITVGTKKDTISGRNLFALTAVKTFIKLHNPEYTVNELRAEQPFTDKKENLFSVWSGIATNNEYSFRIWAKEMIGGFNK